MCLDFGGRKEVVGILKGAKQKIQLESNGHGLGSYKYDTNDEHGIYVVGCKQQQ